MTPIRSLREADRNLHKLVDMHASVERALGRFVSLDGLREELCDAARYVIGRVEEYEDRYGSSGEARMYKNNALRVIARSG